MGFEKKKTMQKMQRNCCHVTFAFILKLLNFLQAFMAVSIILYSLWMLAPPHPDPHPHPHPHPHPLPLPPLPDPHPHPHPEPRPLPLPPLPSPHPRPDPHPHPEPRPLPLPPQPHPRPDPHPHPHPLPLPPHPLPLPPHPLPHPPLHSTAIALLSRFYLSLYSQIAQSRLLSHVHHQVATATWNSVKLPAQWFIYSFMGVGILVGCVTLIGCIAAEATSGGCLCFYALLKTVLIVLEAALVAFIAFDRRWEKDLPFDPTGELDSLRSFIEDNIDICKWVGITVIIIQVLSLLLALILRAMVSSRRTNFDEEYNYSNERDRIKEPLLYQQPNNAHSDIWSSWMREKYGLNNSGEKYSSA